MPWTINSEIYPLWARSTGNACAAGVNWTFNVLVSLTFLHLAQYLTYYGQFLSKTNLKIEDHFFPLQRQSVQTNFNQTKQSCQEQLLPAIISISLHPIASILMQPPPHPFLPELG